MISQGVRIKNNQALIKNNKKMNAYIAKQGERVYYYEK